jgi:hypothetical protein
MTRCGGKNTAHTRSRGPSGGEGAPAPRTACRRLRTRCRWQRRRGPLQHREQQPTRLPRGGHALKRAWQERHRSRNPARDAATVTEVLPPTRSRHDRHVLINLAKPGHVAVQHLVGGAPQHEIRVRRRDPSAFTANNARGATAAASLPFSAPAGPQSAEAGNADGSDSGSPARSVVQATRQPHAVSGRHADDNASRDQQAAQRVTKPPVPATVRPATVPTAHSTDRPTPGPIRTSENHPSVTTHAVPTNESRRLPNALAGACLARSCVCHRPLELWPSEMRSPPIRTTLCSSTRAASRTGVLALNSRSSKR